MKQFILLSLALTFLATPALAARLVYLKGGGIIRAKSAWRSPGKVHVLVNRDTLAEFNTAEIDMKKTFAGRHRTASKTAGKTAPAASKQTGSTGGATAADAGQNVSKPKASLPGLPSLSEKNPESLLPSSGAGGAIRKQKKDLAEKIGE